MQILPKSYHWALLTSILSAALLSSCEKAEGHKAKHEHAQSESTEHAGHEEHLVSKIIASRPLKNDTIVTRDYVAQVHSRQNIEVKALERGYLEVTHIKEGQRVKHGDPMFKITPLVYQAEVRRAEAEAQAAKVEYDNTKRLADSKVVSDAELAISKAKLEKTLAEVNLAQTHLGFTELKAPFNGLVDRLHLRQGSLVEEGELLTTLSDNSEMWVYFNVPEAEYLDYAAEEQPEERKIVSLVMANGQTYSEPGRVNAIEAEFNNETGTIAFRADFQNPKGLLRHGGTGNIVMKKLVKGAILIPQKATFEVLDHHYVFIIGKDGVVTQQRVHISEEIEDLFIINKGLTAEDKIVLEGLRQAKPGEKAEYEFQEPEVAYAHLKLRAE